jgi:heme ABC exporter ATP-binding subunit CcmA
LDLLVEGVHKRFGAVVALAGVDLAIGADTHLLLAGANGAGKTTLLRLLAGLTGPSEGRVTIGGQDPRRSTQQRARLGLLSHQTFLYDDLTAAENLRFFAGLYGLSADVVAPALAGVDLDGHAESRVGGFSRGMKQRLALARATLHAPQVLLLDEPFSGLDRRSAQTLSARLLERTAATGSSSVLVTHNVEEVARFVNRVVVLRGGRIVCDEPWTTADQGPQLQALCDHHQERPR